MVLVKPSQSDIGVTPGGVNASSSFLREIKSSLKKSIKLFKKKNNNLSSNFSLFSWFCMCSTAAMHFYMLVHFTAGVHVCLGGSMSVSSAGVCVCVCVGMSVSVSGF